MAKSSPFVESFFALFLAINRYCAAYKIRRALAAGGVYAFGKALVGGVHLTQPFKNFGRAVIKIFAYKAAERFYRSLRLGAFRRKVLYVTHFGKALHKCLCHILLFHIVFPLCFLFIFGKGGGAAPLTLCLIGKAFKLCFVKR